MNIALALLVLATTGVNSAWQPAGHTARYESSASGRSTDDRYSATAYDTTAGGRYQYNLPAANTTQPPTITSRVQGAAVETGTTLRDGIEAGIQAAGQQLERAGGQLLQRSTNVGQGVGRQFQDLSTGAVRQLDLTVDNVRNAADQTVGAARDTLGVGSLPPLPDLSSNSSTSSPPWTPPAPTPWPMDAFHAENPATGSSAIGTNGSSATQNAAPPSLFSTPLPAATTSTSVTPLPSDDRYRTNPTVPASNDGGLSWPAGTSNTMSPAGSAAGDNPAPIQSVPAGPALSGPPPSSPAGAADAAIGWDTAGSSRATIRRTRDAADRQSSSLGLVPVRSAEPPRQDQPAAGTGSSVQPEAGSRWADPWSGTDPWAQSPQQPSQPAQSSRPSVAATPPAQGNPWPSTTPAAGQTLDGWGDAGTSPSSTPSGAWTGGPAPTTATSSQNQPATQPPQQQSAAATLPTSTTPPSQTVANAAPPQTVPAEQQPWMPLLLVSFGLAGSLGANLFLGWSYMESRHRYRSLAQKTADTFRRAKDLAA